jgi:hypothetical protein
VPVLAPELEPRDSEWGQVCKALNVRLAFPPDFGALIDDTTDQVASLLENLGAKSMES